MITAAVDDETYQPSLKIVYDNILQYHGGPALLVSRTFYRISELNGLPVGAP
jgi:hypothetical protein